MTTISATDIADEDAKKRINVLDHGFVRLIRAMGDDRAIVEAARGSYGEAWRAGEDEGSDTRLIRYLAKHAHTTPFEVVELQFEVKLPIFVWRQWVRHRRFWTQLTVNELSARYRELPEEFYVPALDQICEQSKNNKQGRAQPLNQWSALAVQEAMTQFGKTAFTLYRNMLADGVARELARTVLPLSTYTHMAAKVDLHNLLGFVLLRADPHAQYEICVYADAMLELARGVAPVAVGMWEETRTS